MIQKLLIIIAFVFGVIVVVSQHLIHFADYVARYVGYFVSVGVIPFLFGVCVGVIYLRLVAASAGQYAIFTKTIISMSFGLVALVPVFYTFLMFLSEGG